MIGPMDPASNNGAKPRVGLRQLVTTLLVLGALAAFVWAFSIADTTPEVHTSTSAVERFLPVENSVVELRQTQVGVDLAPGWLADLSIDDTPIPADQLNCFNIQSCESKAPGGVDPQNTFFFVPGEGKVIETLAPGAHCATAALNPVEATANTSPHTVTWCFKVA